MSEIGLAHAIGKPIILITRNQEDVPFDLRSLRYLLYEPNNPFWGEDLQTGLVKMLRDTLENPSLHTHLEKIAVEAEMPQTPDRKEITHKVTQDIDKYLGSWKGKWDSIKTKREHNATLVISKIKDQITATITITYFRQYERTIVQETLSSALRDGNLLLTGVSYTYVERGYSASYSLDNFELRITEDGKKLEGKVLLKNGIRDIMFEKIE